MKNKIIFNILSLALCVTLVSPVCVKAETGGAPAVYGDGEFVSDKEMEKLIEQKEAEIEDYIHSSLAKAPSQLEITAIEQHPQETGNWCAYSSIQSVLEGEGIKVTQREVVNEIPSITNFSSYNFSSNGCPWLMTHGNDVSQFPAAVYLNSKLGYNYYAPYPYGNAGATTLTEANIRARIVYGIGNGHGILVCGTSKMNPKDTSHLKNYTTAYDVGHWIAVKGYSDNGDEIMVVDPVAGSSVSWAANVRAVRMENIKTITAFAQPKGIIY